MSDIPSFENLKYVASLECIQSQGVFYPAQLSVVEIIGKETILHVWCANIGHFRFSEEDMDYNLHKSPVLYPREIHFLTFTLHGLDYEVKVPPYKTYSNVVPKLISLEEMAVLGSQLCGRIGEDDCRFVGCFGENQEQFLRDDWGFDALVDIESRLRPVWKSVVIPRLEKIHLTNPDIYLTPAVGMASYIVEPEEKSSSCKPM